MDRRRAAVLPARKKAEADIRPHPAEVLTESAEACRAEADRFWLLRSLFMEGNVLDLKNVWPMRVLSIGRSLKSCSFVCSMCDARRKHLSGIMMRLQRVNIG